MNTASSPSTAIATAQLPTYKLKNATALLKPLTSSATSATFPSNHGSFSDSIKPDYQVPNAKVSVRDIQD